MPPIARIVKEWEHQGLAFHTHHILSRTGVVENSGKSHCEDLTEPICLPPLRRDSASRTSSLLREKRGGIVIRRGDPTLTSDLNPSSTTAANRSLSFFPRPILLPPHLPISNNVPNDFAQTNQRSSAMPKVEIIFIAIVITVAVLVCLFAAAIGRFTWKKVGTERWEVPGTGKIGGCFRNKNKADSGRVIMKNWAAFWKHISRSQQAPTSFPFQSGKVEKTQQNGGHEDVISSSLEKLQPEVVNQENRPLQTIQDEFDDRFLEQEVDIALALQFALRDRSSPVTFSDDSHCRRLSIIGSLGNDDGLAMLSLRAGVESAGKRTRTIRTWPSADSDDESGTFSERDSSDSMTSIESETTSDEEEDDISDVFELRTVQTRSMDLKKGMLMSWRSSDSLAREDTTIGIPALVISDPSPVIHSPYFPESLSSTSSLDGFLRPPLPGLMVTMPSIRTVGSSTSSVSIDLDDFPSPPSQPSTISTEIDDSPLFQEHDLNSWNFIKTSPAGERRSTVVQLIMMYTNV